MRTRVDAAVLDKIARKAIGAAMRRDEFETLRALSPASRWCSADLYRLAVVVADKAARVLSAQAGMPLGPDWVWDAGAVEAQRRGHERFAMRFLLASMRLQESVRGALWREQRDLSRCVVALVGLAGEMFAQAGEKP